MSMATPFHKLLIANRGEVAMRVIRTARAMGLRTVAVYAGADVDAEHVRAADEAVPIGGALPAQGYLDIEAIVAAARRSGADAVHPGYGFLAENADFAEACRAADLVFVGPSPAAMRAMGHKAGAKQRMQAVGVPVVPGYSGADQSEARLAAEADRIGYPLMVKATAGGGGRGLRLVAASAQFADALRSARSEAKSAFGDDEVLLERAVVAPRHIEIQVLADRHGNAIHLGERDCSVQRRHQKLIEEAPSPAVSPGLRERMGRDAVAAALAVGYEGAGTLEFLLDGEGRHWFMEMNTRLQVEHPVTEAVTGLDLVELQLRIAAGERLPLTQAQVRIEGHAIEVRLCAEDPAQDFMPQSGSIALWRPSPALRVEHALRDGIEIPPFYDSMIAKLVGAGRTRDEALQRLQAGLADTVVLGLATNQGFLQRCLAHPVFGEGGATTDFIAAKGDTLRVERPSSLHLQAALVAAWLLQLGPAAPLACRLPRVLRFLFDGELHTARVEALGNARYRVDCGSREARLALVGRDATAVRFTFDGLQMQATYLHLGSRLVFHLHGRAHETLDLSLAAVARPGAAASDGSLRAAMTGRIVALLVAEGDAVAAGQPLMTLEAMKMEHVHAAPRAGRVAALHVLAGAQVSARQLLAEIEP